MDILLHTYNDQKDVGRERNARELLDALRDSSGTDKSHTQLEAGYRRLWEFNTIDGFDEERIRLFHLIFCSFEPLSLDTLTQALRVQIDGDGSYDREVTSDQVKRLYSNFLTVDTSGHLGFIHNSARDFVSKIKNQDGVDSSDSDSCEFSKERCHLSAAKLYIEITKRPDHPIWQEFDLSPSNWQDSFEFVEFEEAPTYTQYVVDADTFRRKLQNKERSILTYMMGNGLKHCRSAAKSKSIFDELWNDVFVNVILPHKSAFPFTALYLRIFDVYLMRDVFGEYGGKVGLLHSHLLAQLEVVDESDFPDSRLRNLAKAPLNTDSPEGCLRLLLQHATTSNFMGRTALHIACEKGNNSVVKLISEGTFYLYGGATSLDLLFAKTSKPWEEIPFSIAVENSQVAILETLLKFEVQVAGTTSDEHFSDPTENSYKTMQWSYRCGSDRTALSHAALRLDEDTVCNLLSIAQPIEINVKDAFGDTVLHIAASRGYLRLMQMLVEDFKADISVPNSIGRSPSFIAFYCDQNEAFKYLQSRGAQGGFCQEDKDEYRSLILSQRKQRKKSRLRGP